LANRTGSKTMVRAHHVSMAQPFELSNVIDVSDEPHVEELLAIADLLITDYSSIAYDFELTARPVIHFVPDLVDYSKERGIYGAWPRQSIVTEHASELVTIVSNCLDERISAEPVGDTCPDTDRLIRKVVKLGSAFQNG